ncbi:hydroxyacylglutathione hydrolase [Leptospira sp. 85282-16]|uniref:Hydroxyacylglutathione hydrolase n=1 Tax=Leptospira montravelensis TaxID=2484961 RepID=A0ABY2LWR0_9LEPT|nr:MULTISPECIES: hydroxyacylglutathione hydrolase [Leptospira]MCT8332338.1 hydroxyacylglutathione hydrolase [Leptospira sp. 85282-16]TGK83567.1 MBL fold metallo-hydrolase [Leptospira montravelensis]TGL05570.1 MBL fold metallo-hydrolase [Leptospira montravelensis]
MIEILPIFTNSPLRNYSYLVYSNRTGEAYCIDPFDAKEILNLSQKLGVKIKGILNTHEHGDHTQGNLELKEETKAIVYGHKDAKHKIPGMDQILNEGDIVFTSEEESLTVWDTPGHTFSHLSFVRKNPKSILGIFSGDTLFNVGVGNCFRGGDPNVLYETITSRFESLPDSCLLYPGHDYWDNNLKFAEHIDPENSYRKEYKSTLKPFQISKMEDEKKLNPFFRRNTTSVKDSLIKLNEKFLDDRSVFLTLRKLRDKW